MDLDPDVRRLALSCLLLGFVGPTPPAWFERALGEGLGGVVLFASNLGEGGGDVARRLTDRLRRAAGGDIVIAIDEEGGEVTRLDAAYGSASPGPAALGALDDPAATEEVYAAIAARLAESGITTNLAPVADVNVEPRNPVIGLRSFGSDATLVARHVAAAVRGTQRGGVAACLKHFPGHGATTTDSHHEVALLNRDRAALDAVEFEPFRAGIAAGTRAVMTSHLLTPALDPDAVATVSRTISHDVLRGDLGFAGTVMTDALEMRAISATIGIVEGFVGALVAGADAIETGALDYPELIDTIPGAVAAALDDGRLSIERLRDASLHARALARPPGPAAAYEATVLDGVAGRCVEVHGRLPQLHAPLVVQCRPPDGMASGALPWSLAEPLAALVPGVESLDVDGETALNEPDKSLVVVVRDPARHPWQQRILQAVQGNPRAVVVDVGWPVPLDVDIPTVITRGVAPGLLKAAAELLATP